MISEKTLSGNTFFITGAAGYVGAMLVDQLAERADVAHIIALDKEAMPELLKGKEKITWITANTQETHWQDQIRHFSPDVVIHTAWQIREMYGNRSLQWKWNIEGSDTVFDFAFSTPSVKKLIHFSTVASYGAYPSNTLEYRFTENDPFRPSEYLYAEEKRITETHLRTKYEAHKKNNMHVPSVYIVRPAAITGPRGRFMRIRFGLQAALSGQLKENALHRFISKMVTVVPVTKKWCRQFIHEDDVVDIVTLLSFTKNTESEYQVFNICPPGPLVLGTDMAEAVGKKSIRIHPYIIRAVFFLLWHISRGKVPTSKGGWKSYAYPIAVDGSKLSAQYGFVYQYESKEAFTKKAGRYAKYIPDSKNI